VLGLVKTQALASPKTTPFFCAFAAKYTFEPSPDSCLHEPLSLFGIAGAGAFEDTSPGVSASLLLCGEKNSEAAMSRICEGTC